MIKVIAIYEDDGQLSAATFSTRQLAVTLSKDGTVPPEVKRRKRARCLRDWKNTVAVLDEVVDWLPCKWDNAINRFYDIAEPHFNVNWVPDMFRWITEDIENDKPMYNALKKFICNEIS